MIWDFYSGLKLKNPMIRTRDTAFFLIWKRRKFQNKGSVKYLEEKLMKNWKSGYLHKPFLRKSYLYGSIIFLKTQKWELKCYSLNLKSTTLTWLSKYLCSVLAENLVKEVNKKIFHGLVNLKTLSLYSNKISCVTPGAFDALGKKNLPF